MNIYLKVIYLGFVFVLVGILYIAIYRSGPPPNRASENRAQAAKQEFKPLAARIKETEEETKRAEERMVHVRVDSEYESMVLIPAGTFIMGNNQSSAMEQPERKVFLDDYFIDRYEVTFAHFYAFVAATNHRKPRLAGYLAVDAEGIPVLLNPYSPAVGVSWDDADAYCYWRGKRLPTEAEWEKAAKGVDQRKWPWGDEENPNFANLVGAEDGFRYTSPVGSFKQDRSPFGVYDMAGNAMEWVSSWFQEDYYQFMPVLNPKGPEKGENRGIRGASWNDSILRAKTTIRFKTRPTYRDVTIGFRCVKSRT